MCLVCMYVSVCQHVCESIHVCLSACLYLSSLAVGFRLSTNHGRYNRTVEPGCCLTSGDVVPVGTEELVDARLDELEQFCLVSVRTAERRKATQQDVGDDT